MDWILFILTLGFYCFFMMMCLVALAIPILFWGQASKISVSYLGKGFTYARNFVLFVIWPTLLIALGIYFLIDLGS